MAYKTELLASFEGGVNLRGQPLDIAPNELLACINMYPVAAGYLIGRGGQTRYTQAGPINANPIKSLYRFYKQNGQGIQLATTSTNVFTVNDVTGVPTSILGGLTANQRFSFVTWTAKDKVYWTNGIEPMQSYNGTTVAAVGGGSPVALQIELYLDRMYALTNNGVRFSDLNVDNSWQAAALLNISDNQGGTGSFLKAANQVLIAGKTSGLWRLEGSPLLGNAFRPYSSVGCIAPWTVDTVTVLSNGQAIAVGVVFLGKDGVYLTDGFDVRLISAKIDPLFTSYFRNAVGKYYRKKRQYFLSFNNAGGPNDTLWACTNLDMAGSQLAWTFYTGFNCDSFAEWDGGADNGEFLAGQSDIGHINRLDVGKQDLGADYMCGFTTRYLGDPAVNKQVRWIKPVFDATKQVHFGVDYFQKQFSSGSVSVDTVASLIWDVGQWDVDKWAGPSFNSARTSVLDGRYGRYLSLSFQNTGDGSDFRFFQVETEMRIKDRRTYDVFSLNASP